MHCKSGIYIGAFISHTIIAFPLLLLITLNKYKKNKMFR